MIYYGGYRSQLTPLRSTNQNSMLREIDQNYFPISLAIIDLFNAFLHFANAIHGEHHFIFIYFEHQESIAAISVTLNT